MRAGAVAAAAKRAADKAEWERPVTITLAGGPRFTVRMLIEDEVMRLEAEARQVRAGTRRHKALNAAVDELRAIAGQLA